MPRRKKSHSPDDVHSPAVMIGTPPPKDLVLETPEGEPNISIKVFTPLMAILARAGNVFFSTLVGALGVTATGVIPGTTWKEGVAIAISATLVATAQSAVTIFSDLEKKFPLLRA
jgi:hypothetical protein